MTTVAIYARISQDRDNRRVGVDDQERRGREYAESRGWTVHDVYVDNDVSATVVPLPDRPGGARLLDDAEAGRFGAIWAIEDERLWRDEVEQRAVFALLTECGVGTVVAGTDEYDTADDTDITPTLKALLGRAETAKMGRRIRRRMRQLAEAGKPTGGKRPYGFEEDHITHRPEEVERIREAAERVLAGEGWTTIARDYNERGVPTATGGDWYGSTLRDILTSARVAGVSTYHGEEVGEAIWEPILDPEMVHRLRARVNRTGPRVNGRRDRHLLTGFLYCDECGDTMVTSADGEYRTYACRGCYKLSVSAARIEDEVRARVLARTSHLAAWLRRPSETPGDRQRILDELAEVERRRDELLEAFEGGGSAKMLARASERLDEREEELRNELVQFEEDEEAREALAVTRADLEALWESDDIAAQRSTLQLIVDRVVLTRATRSGVWDNERVEVDWRV